MVFELENVKDVIRFFFLHHTVHEVIPDKAGNNWIRLIGGIDVSGSELVLKISQGSSPHGEGPIQISMEYLFPRQKGSRALTRFCLLGSASMPNSCISSQWKIRTQFMFIEKPQPHLSF